MSNAGPIEKLVSEWLANGHGRLGQVAIRRSDEGWEMVHVSDAEKPAGALTAHQGPFAALEISKYNEAGAFRALKGAFDLAPGWVLRLHDLAEVREALDAFYPAALGLWAAHLGGRVRTASLRETLQRQTGIYRITQTLTDAGARNIVENRCWSTCLRVRLWDIDEIPASAHPDTPHGVLPFLCPEACNLLVSDAREEALAEGQALRAETS